MKQSKIKYKLVSSNWDKEEIDSMKEVISSGFFTMGKKVDLFQKKFADYHKKKFAIMVNSGSSANLIGIASLFYKKKNPLKPGDEVIVPAISWSTSYYPLLQYGLKCKFVDVDLNTLNIDLSKLRKSITKKTKLIFNVSILGNPTKLFEIKKICNSNKIYLFEDNCESLDAEINNKKTGTFGDLSSSSFFFSHHINTMEGGMILTDSKELANICLSLRAHGWTRDLLNKKKSKHLVEMYDFIYPGYNVRPLELSAACGIVQLKKLVNMTKIRRKNLKIFENLFKKDERFIIQKEYGKSSCFSFPIILNKKFNPDREKIFGALKKSNIEFRIITGGCFTRHSVIKYFDVNSKVNQQLPNANYAHDYGFFVGNYPKDLSKELNLLYRILDENFKRK